MNKSPETRNFELKTPENGSIHRRLHHKMALSRVGAQGTCFTRDSADIGNSGPRAHIFPAGFPLPLPSATRGTWSVRRSLSWACPIAVPSGMCHRATCTTIHEAGSACDTLRPLPSKEIYGQRSRTNVSSPCALRDTAFRICNVLFFENSAGQDPIIPVNSLCYRSLRVPSL